MASSAADAALQQVLDRRLRKREGRPPAAVARTFGSAQSGVAASIDRFGLPQWLFRVSVLGFVTAVLGAVVMIQSARPRPPVPLHDFRVTVVVGTTVPVGARVVLHPRSGSLPGEVVPQGTVGEDGWVSFITYPPALGVPAGDYVATVQWFRVAADGSVGGNAVPARYTLADRSPLLVTVVPDATGRETLRLALK